LCDGEMSGCEQALTEVATDDLFGISDGGEVGASVPFEEEIEVEGELRDQTCRRIGQIGCEKRCDCGF